MLCQWLVTISLIIAPPDIHNTMGTLKVKQFSFKSQIIAKKFATFFVNGLGLKDGKEKLYIQGVGLDEMPPFKCEDFLRGDK